MSNCKKEVQTVSVVKKSSQDQKLTEPTRTLRSSTVRQSKDVLKRDRKRKATSAADGTAHQKIRKRAHLRAFQSGDTNSATRKHSITKVPQQKDKKSGLKPKSKSSLIDKRKPNSQPKARRPTGKNYNSKTKKSCTRLSKSVNGDRIGKATTSQRKGTKRKPNERGETGCPTGRDKTALHKPKIMTLQNLPTKGRIRVVGKLNTDLREMITKICCIDEKTLWVGRQVIERLMKVKYTTTGKLTVLKQFEHLDFVDFCFDREYNQILYCGRINNSIMAISSNFEVKQMTSVKPLCPTCITMSADNFIFVGLSQYYAYDCTVDPSPRQIVKMDRQGTIHQRISSLQDGSSNFLFTQRCTINPVNNDLIVIGFKNSCDAYIANFDSDGMNGFLYNGQRSTKRSFNPRGLTCSPQGNIIVCDEDSGDIHILNKYGGCLQLMRWKVSGLPEKPWSLAWDFFGHLLIGTSTRKTGNILLTEYTENDDDD